MKVWCVKWVTSRVRLNVMGGVRVNVRFRVKLKVLVIRLISGVYMYIYI